MNEAVQGKAATVVRETIWKGSEPRPDLDKVGMQVVQALADAGLLLDGEREFRLGQEIVNLQLEALGEKERAEWWEASYRDVSEALAQHARRIQAVEKLCDEYRANCDPTSIQAQVAEIFRLAASVPDPETAQNEEGAA